ncbi:MAG: hypothetical protein NC410_08895 [Oscillibacter sp.]|nr:hypothetical protein [Oscillibacter sp.]
MIPLIATAAMSALSSGLSAAKARKAAKQQRKLLNQLNQDNENMFLRDYYSDFMDDPTSRSYLKRISEDLYDKNEAIESSGIATGATHENIQAQKAAANRTMSDAINNVVVNHEARKEAAKNRYINRKDAITQGKTELAQQEAQNWANLGSNISDSITGLASTYLMSDKNLLGNKTASPATSSTLSSSDVSKNMDFMKNNNIHYKNPYTQF